MNRPLTKTQKELLQKEEDYEKAGMFHEHVQEINWNAVQKVTENYEFLPDSIKFNAWQVFCRSVATSLGPLVDRLICGTRVKGRENLYNVNKAIVICNHVHDLDNMMVRQAVFGHKLYITVGEFNNTANLLGSVLRGAGTLPFSSNRKAMSNLNDAIGEVLNKNCYVLFYPEGSLWWRYEKPRPFLDGAFHYAEKFDVPVIPAFITFKKPDWFRRIFSSKKVTVINLLPPVYPKEDLSRKENIDYLRDRSFSEVKACYESVYRKPLVYEQHSNDAGFLTGTEKVYAKSSMEKNF